MLKIARNALGIIIVFFEWVSRPKKPTRSEAVQIKVQNALQGHSLYQFLGCPFCVKTRRAIHQLGINIEMRDINKTPRYRTELEINGGRVLVPCLRIEEQDNVKWLYESNDIIAYLQQRVATAIAGTSRAEQAPAA